MQKELSAPGGTQAGKLWKVDEAAAFLNISSGTLYHWVSERKIPCMHFGVRCLRFDPQELKQWAATFGQLDRTHK